MSLGIVVAVVVVVVVGRGGSGLLVMGVGAAGVGLAACRAGEAMVMAASVPLVFSAGEAILGGLPGGVDL